MHNLVTSGLIWAQERMESIMRSRLLDQECHYRVWRVWTGGAWKGIYLFSYRIGKELYFT